jgi:hypothetical protein
MEYGGSGQKRQTETGGFVLVLENLHRLVGPPDGIRTSRAVENLAPNPKIFVVSD